MKTLKHILAAVLFTLILASLSGCDVKVSINKAEADHGAVDNSGGNNETVSGAVEDKDACPDDDWWRDTIAYEIYVKSFKDSDGDGTGDLNGITSELDHLQNLGVGAVWLTPCYSSPQADNGYDIADYYSIDPTYGTMKDMDRLIEEAKKRDIRIVMDLVFNHTSNRNPWFVESASGKDNAKSDWSGTYPPAAPP